MESKEPRRTVGAIAIVKRSDCRGELSTQPIVDASHPSVNPPASLMARHWALCTAHNAAAELTGTHFSSLAHRGWAAQGRAGSGDWRRFALRGRRQGNHECDPHIPAIGPVVYAACVSLDHARMQIEDKLVNRRRIISGSAENRGNSCPLSDQPTPAQPSLLRSWH
jgi:hypothetical protein